MPSDEPRSTLWRRTRVRRHRRRWNSLGRPPIGWTSTSPRTPDPELDKVIHPRGAKSFYSLSSGFVHGFKWLTAYVSDDSDLLAVTLDALGNALRMTECAVSLHEAQSIGPRPDPGRVRNYPAGLAETVEHWAPRYRVADDSAR